jgi:hypothetical protein
MVKIFRKRSIAVAQEPLVKKTTTTGAGFIELSPEEEKREKERNVMRIKPIMPLPGTHPVPVPGPGQMPQKQSAKAAREKLSRFVNLRF